MDTSTCTSMAHNTSLGALGDTSVPVIHALDTLLKSLSKDDIATQKAVSIILFHESFK